MEQIPVSGGELYAWNEDSTYIQEPPFFVDLTPEVKPITNIENARVLVKAGDSITTDHISPAGSIAAASPAAAYLREEAASSRWTSIPMGPAVAMICVMTRGTFANIRMRNQLAPGTEGGWTTYPPDRSSHDHL